MPTAVISPDSFPIILFLWNLESKNYSPCLKLTAYMPCNHNEKLIVVMTTH